MIVPDWLPFALGALLTNAAVPLAQERFRAPPFALAMGLKIVVALATLPFMLTAGVPDAPRFYVLTAMMGVVWCISDVQFFTAVREVGAGPVSRLLPGMQIVSFLLWFAVDPALLGQYAQTPWRSAGIALCVVGATVFAMRLHRCAVSRRTARLLWFTLVANALGPVVNKVIIGAGPSGQTAFAFTCLEAMIMVSLWLTYALARRGRPLQPLRDPAARTAAVRASVSGGLAMAANGVFFSLAIAGAEHPTYVTVLEHASVLLIIAAHRFWGARDDSDVSSGVGMAACAVALVLLKSL